MRGLYLIQITESSSECLLKVILFLKEVEMVFTLTQRVAPFLTLLTWPTPARPSKLHAEGTHLGKLLHRSPPLSLPSVNIGSIVVSTLDTTHHSKLLTRRQELGSGVA